LGLERNGKFEVDVYNDPTTALANYRPGVYDLLLLDVKMPKMNGLEAYQKNK
jgi:two-component system response regulator ChvI